MKILSGDVNTVDVTKGVKKMSNTISVDWETIYNGQEETAEKIIKGLYDTKNYEELHRAMWSWLSLDGTKDKWEWFKRFDVPAVSHYCFACEMAETSFRCNPPIGYALEEENDIKSPICYYCPITAPSAISCLDGLYEKWWSTEYLEERKEAANGIANLEWK